MTNIAIGLIPSPDMPHKLINKISDYLADDIHNHVDDKTNWDFETHVASMVGTAEHMDKALDIASNIKKQKNWDYTICITDLPSLSNNKTVICDINLDDKTSLISVPALGAVNLKHKLRHFITFIVKYFFTSGSDKSLLKSKYFKLTKFNEVIPNEDNKQDNRKRIVSKTSFLGWFHLILGTTFSNEPWSAILDFKKIISVSFATGTYIAIFSTPWDLSLDYEYWRFILLMLLSISGMVGWLIYSYNLWERPNPKTQQSYRFIYNFTTLTTLFAITIFNFAALFILLTISTLLFVPPEIFSSWTSLNEKQPTFVNYINLIWFITSLGILAGAMGSTVENAEKIKRVTYSFRQYYRYKELEQDDDNTNSTNQASDYNNGKKLSHSEGDSNDK